MKKTLLGKITIILACMFVLAYVSEKVYSIWFVGHNYGWNEFIALSHSVSGGYGVFDVFCGYFVKPIVWCIVFAIYLFEIGHNKRINRLAFVSTAIAISLDILLDIITCLHTGDMIPVLSLLRIGFLLAFIMVFMNWAKGGAKKILYAVLCCSYIGAFVLLISPFKYHLTVFVQMLNSSKNIMNVCLYAATFTRPILALIVCTLIVCYRLWKERR